MTNFPEITPALGEALTKRGFETLTPVQEAVIDPSLTGRDLLVSAQTGSGKTVAFGIAIAPYILDDVTRFAANGGPLALVVAPTRELALQVARELSWLYGASGAKIATCVGGMDFRTEKRALDRGAHIVVGTPGRLCDHIRRQSFDPAVLGAVILDEADEMLDLGFRDDLEFILQTTPEERRTLMFSATVSRPIAQLAKKYQRDSVRVNTVQEQKQHRDIDYRALTIAPRERDHAIVNILRFYDARNTLVFCNTRANVNQLVSRLNNRGFSVVALSGELNQNARTHALQAMRDGRARVCVATDVAARGIDLPNLDLVIHADLPTNKETLLHRSGRTGRAGRKGVSILIVDTKSRGKAERVLRGGKITAEWASPPSADEVLRKDEERMLSDPILTEAVREDEQVLVDKILADFTPEQIATGYLRQVRAQRTAPEVLDGSNFADGEEPGFVPKNRPGRKERQLRKKRDSSPRKPDGDRTSFSNSVWVSLSVGRKHRAEPRWLIPLICNGGGITKQEIGAIKLQDEQTFVELNGDIADQFFSKLGPRRSLERNVRADRLKGVPEFDTKLYLDHNDTKDNRPFQKKRANAEEREDQNLDGNKREKSKSHDEDFRIKRKPRKKGSPVKAGASVRIDDLDAEYGGRKSKDKKKPGSKKTKPYSKSGGEGKFKKPKSKPSTSKKAKSKKPKAGSAKGRKTPKPGRAARKAR